MALDLDGKLVSPGQVQISTWDDDQNAVRVNVVASSGGGGATAANQATQITVANNTLTAIQALEGDTSLSPVGTPVYNAYASTAVTTGAYVAMVASTPFDVKAIEIFDSSGQSIYLATGAALSESNKVIITPGGNGRIPFIVSAGTRLSVKALTANATTGYLVINFYS